MAHDPVLLITGASTGIGAATARLAAEHGYRLVLGARSGDKLTALAEELGGPERAIAVRCDVTEAADQDAAVQRALDAFGRLDAVLANAGVSLGDRGFESGDPDEWRAMILTNVLGVALSIRAAARALKKTKGHLLITSSMAGRRPLKGSLYSATKFAVTAMGEAARQDFNGTGVRVTLLSPGLVETPGFPHGRDDILAADDIARAILFALTQPPHVDVNEIAIRPTAQDS
jgi:NADP-dependent 3-hydroxy acid dehydrogenase YdfG